ncbi:hypothetical protein L8C07_25620 [Paenibacillus sp. CMAA1739]|uniref:hypothetical protein n=1 Tax=Paenibacillus ottowii TaxID=2315729 RepID=UPI002DBF5057|nr:hypothetical protein [Paenibacillus sp. CMAA1739]MEC4569329.1 hypothetical protein [Paenibacillus sp. CMAA1739]
MPVFTYGYFKTDIDVDSELYEYLNEVNQLLDKTKIIIQRDVIKTSVWKKSKPIYRMYVDFGNGSYQIIGSASGDERVTTAYLIGVLTGIQRGRNNNDR